MPALNKFGSSAGSGAPAIIIAAVTIGAGQIANITEFGAEAAATSADSVIFLELSTDNFGASNVEVDRIELPTGGTALKTYDSPIEVRGGLSFRVRFAQGTPGTIGANLSGEATQRITDI